MYVREAGLSMMLRSKADVCPRSKHNPIQRHAWPWHRRHGQHPGGNQGDDDPIVEDYFKGAIVDNFAPRDLQRPWHRSVGMALRPNPRKGRGRSD